MNIVASRKMLLAIAEAYAEADKLALNFWSSPDGRELGNQPSCGWILTNQAEKYKYFADQVATSTNSTEPLVK
jgi:hypothetical protein